MFVSKAPDQIVLVQSEEDVDALRLEDPEKVAYISQTTLSVDETRAIINRLRERFPAIIGPRTDDICYATQNRQDAVRELAKSCDAILVVGSSNSSNSMRLVEVAERVDPLADHVMALAAVQIHDERDATGVVLEGGVVEALPARKVSIPCDVISTM